MGASSESTGTIVNPVTTTSVGTTTYGQKSLNIINQSGGISVPSYSYNLPVAPKFTLPEQIRGTTKSFQPDLGPFEPNR